MPIVNGAFVLPGVFSQIQANLLPTAPGGIRIPALVGDGRTTNLVSNEEVTRGNTAPPSTDALAHTATAIVGNIQDENFVIYTQNVDFDLDTGAVGWLSQAASLTGTEVETFDLSGNDKTFILAIANGALQTYTFVDGDFGTPTAATATEVATALNTFFTANSIDAIASTDTGHVVVSTTATSDSSLFIGSGTSNPILGFTSGSYVTTPQAPAAGVNYFVTYEYAKVAADYTPKFYFTLQSVVNDYGPVSDSTSISLGASLAFQNGASIVCVCQQDPADSSVFAQVQNALNKLLATANISIVVSLAGAENAQLLPEIKQHVDTASSTINKLERTAIVGLEGTYTDQDMLGFASSVSDNRVVLLNASETTNKLFIGTDTTETVVGGQFVAAALAGVRCNPAFDVAQPMTREVISGFSSITNTLTQAEKALLINQGVCVVDTIQAVPKVLFGTTTDFSTVANQLYQVTQIMDFVAQSLRGLLDPIFIGQKLLANTPSQVATVTSAILQTIQADTIIIGFTTPSAVVDPQVPTQINLSVGVQPTLETDVILITLGLNLQ